MVVVIDGYNLLKQIFYKQKDKLHKQRDELIKQLAFYYDKKKEVISQIVVVFDAGPFLHASREVHGGVVVMFSGQRSNADRWIVSFVEKNKHKSLLVITTDRELRNQCENKGADSMEVGSFYSILQNALLDDVVAIIEQENGQGSVKFENETDRANPLSDESQKALDT